MATTVDDTTVARWTGDISTSTTAISGTFTPPNDSLLVVCVNLDENPGPNAPTFSGGGWTYTIQVARGNADALEGYAAIATAPVGTGASMAITLGRTGDGGNRRISGKCYIVTGQHASPIGANAEAAWADDPQSLSLTATGAGRLFGCGTDWSAGGVPVSTDVEDGAHYAGQISVMSAYKSADHSSGSQSIDFDPVAVPSGNVVILEILAAGVAGGTSRPRRRHFSNGIPLWSENGLC